MCVDDVDGDQRPRGPASDVGADEFGEPPPHVVSDLRVSHAIVASGVATVTLQWVPLDGAVTTSLKYAQTRIIEGNWVSATLLIDSLPGGANSIVATVPYADGTLYFALKSRQESGRSDHELLDTRCLYAGSHVLAD